MAPADLRKEGSAYDLPLSIGILAASAQIQAPKVGEYVLMGELALDGKIRPIKGALPIAIQALKDGFKGIILPRKTKKKLPLSKDWTFTEWITSQRSSLFLKEQNLLNPH